MFYYPVGTEICHVEWADFKAMDDQNFLTDANIQFYILYIYSSSI